MLLARSKSAPAVVGSEALRRPAALLAVVVAAFLLLFQQGEVTVSDGATMYAAGRSLADQGSLVIPAEYARGSAVGPHGEHYSKYGIGLSLLTIPPYVLGKAVASAVGHGDVIESAAVASLMPLIAAALAVAVFLLSIRLGAQSSSAVLLGGGAVLGTYALPYGKDFFAEPLTTLFLTVAFERALARRPLAAGVFMGAACLTRPQCFAVALLLVAVVTSTQGRRPGWRSTIPLLATGAIQAWLNTIRYGDPLSFGYGNETFTNNPLTGLGHLLVDPSKSVIIFAPILVLLPAALLMLWRTRRDACVLLTGNLVITALIAASWDSWQGGWSWGPRLLLPGVLPALAAVATWVDARENNRQIAAAALALGFVISASTLVVPTQAQELDRPVPAVGPGVVRQIELFGPSLSYTRHHALTPNRADQVSGLHRRFINVWQVGVARELGRSAFAAALVLSMLIGVVLLVAGWRLVEACRWTHSPPTQLTPLRTPARSS